MIRSDVNLKTLNTFGINVSAKFFSEAFNEDQVRAIICYSQKTSMVLF